LSTGWFSSFTSPAVEETGADAVFCLCSSLGPVIDIAKKLVDIPVIKIDEAMAEKAVKDANKIGVMATVPTTWGPTVDLIMEKAELLGKQVTKVEGIDPEMQIECAVNNLLWAGSRAKEKGITLLVEQLNPIDFPKCFLSSLETAVSIIKKIQYENVKLLFDAYHVEMIGEDSIIMLEKYYDYIGHIQIADVPGRHEPGSGRINFNEFFSLLKRKNYQGYIGLEYRSSNNTKESLKWIKKYR